MNDQQATETIAGVDEVGRGPLAGPVVAAAVIMPARPVPAALTDSKKLTSRKRALLVPVIEQMAVACALGWASVAEIDQYNILQATLLAMQRAVLNLSVYPAQALVDGNKAPELYCPVRTIVGGDGQIAAISAASVLAKVARDQYMATLARQYPGYDLAANKGYGTARHRQALQSLGATPIHRRSFAPVARAMQTAQPDFDQG